MQITLKESFHGTQRVLSWEDGRKIDAKIPPGVKTGSRVRLKGQGQPGFGGGKPGDLYLNIEVLPDINFQREEDDLKTSAKVDLFTLLLGGKAKISGIDRDVTIDIPPENPNDREKQMLEAHHRRDEKLLAEIEDLRRKLNGTM